MGGEMSQREILQYAIENGMIDTVYVQEKIEMQKRKELLRKHPYAIWEDKNGIWHTYLPDEKKGRIHRKRNDKKAIESVIMSYWKNIEDTPETFSDCYKRWREVQDQLVTDNTVAKYNTDYKRYFENAEFFNEAVKNINEEDVKVFICATVKEKKLCNKACKTLFGYVKNTFHSAMINKVIVENPMAFLEAKQFYKYCSQKERPIDKTLVSRDDFSRLSRQFAEDHSKNPNYIPTYAVEMASLTGMRAGELSALSWSDDKGTYLLIRKSEKFNRRTKSFFIDETKNKKSRVFPITPEIRKLLDDVKQVEKQYGYICEWVFANEDGRIHAPVISSCLKTKCRQLGIEERGIHSYRRTINSNLRCNGVSSTVAASLLGHTKEVNEQYYTFDVSTMDEKKEAVEAASRDQAC